MKAFPLGILFVMALASTRPASCAAAEPEEAPASAVDSSKHPDLDAIAGWLHFKSAPDSLYRHLTDEAYSLLDERNRRVRALHSAAEWKSQQDEVRHTLWDMMGPWPERTPLNARIVRTIEHADYHIEHIVFESQPGFFVTSSLFLPRPLVGKAPVILYCSGHSDAGYRGIYTRIILNFVKKGFIVFAWDPIGQGERLQYLDRSGKSVVGTGTKEHAYMNLQTMLTGRSLARDTIWDGMRAVDYLETRPEVDSNRIGATGRSGGGFQSLYIPAFDDRIYATAPENHVTNSTRILQKIGPRDGEQNLPRMFARGIDHADLLTVRAPKPTLVVATANDIFNIDGTRETVSEVRLPYGALGGADNLSLSEDIAGHESTTTNNERIYAFFQKSLNQPGSPKSEQVEMPAKGEMQVTRTGQVGSDFGGETVPSLTRQEADRLAAKLATEAREGRLPPARLIEAARQRTGYRPPNGDDQPVLTGSARREGYVVERYFIKGEGDYPIPYVLMIPAQPNGKAILYLHPRGKAAEGDKGGEIEWLVKQGYRVLAPDLIGTGETGPGDSAGDKDFVHRINTGIGYRTWYVGMFIDHSILGVRAADVVKLARVLKAGGAVEVTAVARGTMGPVLLHAAAFTDAIARVAIVEAPASYRSLATTTLYDPGYIETFVPDVLCSYDLPYLAGALSPRRLLVHHPLDGAGESMPDAEATREYEATATAYRAQGHPENFRLSHSTDTLAALTELLRD